MQQERFNQAVHEAGWETFEEADDFDVDDEYNPMSPHEMSIDQEMEGYGDPGNNGSPKTEEKPAPKGDGETTKPVQSDRKETPSSKEGVK